MTRTARLWWGLALTMNLYWVTAVILHSVATNRLCEERYGDGTSICAYGEAQQALKTYDTHLSYMMVLLVGTVLLFVILLRESEKDSKAQAALQQSVQELLGNITDGSCSILDKSLYQTVAQLGKSTRMYLRGTEPDLKYLEKRLSEVNEALKRYLVAADEEALQESRAAIVAYSRWVMSEIQDTTVEEG